MAIKLVDSWEMHQLSNSGISWQAANTGNQMSVTSLVIDPNTPSTLYAGTDSYTYVYKSLNEGQSWQALPFDLEQRTAGLPHPVFSD